MFVHLLDTQGHMISQFDRPAGGAGWPSSNWQPGETLRDTFPLSIPDGTPNGSYQLHIGMYSWPSMDRLPISIGGDPIGDSIILATIEIER